MEFIECCEYATIKIHSTVIIGPKMSNWIPDDARPKNGVVLKEIARKYTSMVFKVESIKPYPERRRMAITGVFCEESVFSGPKRVQAWKDDLIFYIFMEGMLVPLAAPKPKKTIMPIF